MKVTHPTLLAFTQTRSAALRAWLEPTAREAGLELQVCSLADGTVQEALAGGPEPAAVVLAEDLSEPLPIARQVYRRAPLTQLVFVAEGEAARKLRQAMVLAPMIGTYWSIVTPAELPEALQRAIRSSAQRRQLRTTLDKLKVRLASEPPKDTDDYRKLVISDRYLASILNHAPDAIFSVDPRGRLLTWNRGAEALFGLGEAEVLRQPLARLGEALMAPVEAVLAGDAEATRREYRLQRADGTAFDAELTFAPVHDESGRTMAVSMIARDVTARKAAEDALRKAHSELEQRVRERTRELELTVRELEAFSYSVSHDLRAPLRGIDGFSKILAEDYADKLGDEAARYLARIRAGAQRMGTIIDDLLTLSRVTRGRVATQRVDLSALAREVIGALREAEPEREVQVTITDNLVVEGDVQLLRLALENLLGNAWKFTRLEPRAQIAFEAKVVEGGMVYLVRDNGVGFDMAHADKLFAAFQRLHDAAEFEGTGIGLATVRRIIERHGGRIWAEGIEGEGATFCFTLAPTAGRRSA